MAAMYPGQVSAVQVGSFFVKQYYEIIQQTPQYGYQFYSDASTAIRIDGDIEQTAKSAVQIHNLLIALNFTSIEVKTIHSLNSWDGGVLVMVSGFVQIKDYASRRRFVQTFFLAPQEKGFFVLNDIFHFLEEEVTLQPSIMALHHNDYEDNQLGHDNYDNNHLVHDNYESASNSMNHHKHLVHDNYDSASNSMNHHVSDVVGYDVEEELHANEYVSHIDDHELHAREYVPKHHIDEREYVHVDESDYGTTLNENDIDTIDKYSIPDPYQLQQQLQVSNVDEKVDEVHVEELVASFPSAVSMTRDSSASTREFVEERPKLTYASILRLAKAQPDNSVPQAAPVRKAAPVVSEVQSSAPQQAYTEDFTYEAVEESANDYDVEADPLQMTSSEASRSVRNYSHPTTERFSSDRHDGPEVVTPPSFNPYSPFSPHAYSGNRAQTQGRGYYPVATSDSAYSQTSSGRRNPSVESTPPLQQPQSYFDIPPHQQSELPDFRNQNLRHGHDVSPIRRPSQHGRNWSNASDVSASSSSPLVELDAGDDGELKFSLGKAWKVLGLGSWKGKVSVNRKPENLSLKDSPTTTLDRDLKTVLSNVPEEAGSFINATEAEQVVDDDETRAQRPRSSDTGRESRASRPRSGLSNAELREASIRNVVRAKPSKPKEIMIRNSGGAEASGSRNANGKADEAGF